MWSAPLKDMLEQAEGCRGAGKGSRRCFVVLSVQCGAGPCKGLVAAATAPSAAADDVLGDTGSSTDRRAMAEEAEYEVPPSGEYLVLVDSERLLVCSRL